MALRVTTPPAASAVSVAEAKAHLRLDFSDDDSLIDAYVKAAEGLAESHTQRRFVTQTVEWSAPAFCCTLPVAPVDPDSIVVSYVPDGESDLVVWPRSNYVVRSGGSLGVVQIFPKAGVALPFVENDVDEPIVIAFDVGSAADEVAPEIKAAIKLMVGDLYDNRETVAARGVGVVPMSTTVEALLRAWVRG